MKNKKGFIRFEIIPVLVLIEIVVVLIIFVFIIAFDLSMYFQWKKFSNVEEASIKISNIAKDLDECIASGKDCGTCSQMMMDQSNEPFLISAYQSRNFRFDIDSYLPGSSSCVINAVKVDADRIPEYNSTLSPQVSFKCGGQQIDLGKTISGIDLCRDSTGNRTTYGFGAFQSI